MGWQIPAAHKRYLSGVYRPCELWLHPVIPFTVSIRRGGPVVVIRAAPVESVHAHQEEEGLPGVTRRHTRRRRSSRRHAMLRESNPLPAGLYPMHGPAVRVIRSPRDSLTPVGIPALFSESLLKRGRSSQTTESPSHHDQHRTSHLQKNVCCAPTPPVSQNGVLDS